MFKGTTDEPCTSSLQTRASHGTKMLSAEALAEADVRVVTRSARIETARGIGSVAEAAALAAGGPEARLALPRITSAGATCALAAVADGAAPVQEGP
ncbi:cobalamin biosynthesis protein [uncultured Methylobacterium sp.]|uniref:cobalamin biosynthesis protein n=1 Tax=uncultured Methylobacterium sp. TaxID=157278 RepID=UPI0025915CA3|nr:cobalamin biosynthesis protein [uncultured Methylobacterium sp.]